VSGFVPVIDTVAILRLVGEVLVVVCTQEFPEDGSAPVDGGDTR
jgi:hypothetical protein